MSDALDQKMLVSCALVAALFVVVSHARTYEFTNSLVQQVLPDVELVDENGEPSMMGYVVHGLVFCLVLNVAKNQLQLPIEC